METNITAVQALFLKGRQTLMQPKLFHLHALSPLHCGTGQSADVVDLPIARARATQLPIVPGSSLRGVLRQHVTDSNPSNPTAVETLFGPKKIQSNQNAFAGALTIGDAHLLVLPVRCLAGIVSYVTSPFILRCYERDLRRAGVSLPGSVPVATQGAAKVTANSVNCINQQLVLDDLDLSASVDPSLNDWATHIAQAVHPQNTEAQKDLSDRFVLLPDKVMDFLAETATEVRARIAIDPDTGTVSKGALWYEENLPADAILWGIFALSKPNNQNPAGTAFKTALPNTDTLLQLGGNAGVGSGLVRFLLS